MYTFMIHMYIHLCIVVNNSLEVNIGQPSIVRQGVLVTINCVELINQKISSGVQNPTVNWYKDGAVLTNGSQMNVVISSDHGYCIIDRTVLHASGTTGNYTCEVCSGTTSCINKTSSQVVCGEKWLLQSFIKNFVFLAYIGIPHIQPPQSDPIIFPSFISLTCANDVTSPSLQGFTISFSCQEHNGSQPLTITMYKDDTVVTNNGRSHDFINADNSHFATYTFVLSTVHCGSAKVISRLLQQGQLL